MWLINLDGFLHCHVEEQRTNDSFWRRLVESPIHPNLQTLVTGAPRHPPQHLQRRGASGQRRAPRE